MTQAANVSTAPDLAPMVSSPNWPARAWRLARAKPMGTVALLIILAYWLAALFAPILAHSGYNDPLFGPALHSPNGRFWFGTDNSGRDVYSRVIWAARTDLVVSLVTSLVGVLLALVLGAMSAYFAGIFDLIIQRVVDTIQAMPGLILLLVIVAVLGTDIVYPMAAITLLTIPVGLRIVRAAVLQIRAMPYVESARVIGAADSRIIIRHVLPNVMPLVVILVTIALGVNLLIESSLAFLGLVSSNYPDWGVMLSSGAIGYMEQGPWLALAPGIAITGIVFAYSMFGDAARDVLDPRLRGS
jgi:peptide/nickel transport system permease protein